MDRTSKCFLPFRFLHRNLCVCVYIYIYIYISPSFVPHALSISYLLTPWSRVLLEKLTGSAASQEIHRFFGARMIITVLTSARHLSLSWENSIQSSQPPPTSWRFILILSSHLRLGLPIGLFPSGFPTKILCTPLPSSSLIWWPRWYFVRSTNHELSVDLWLQLLFNYS